jgi:hypothetical protein
MKGIICVVEGAHKWLEVKPISGVNIVHEGLLWEELRWSGIEILR